MAKARRGAYQQKGMKLRVKAQATDIEGKHGPSLRLTLFLSKDAVHRIYPQIKRFVEKHAR